MGTRLILPLHAMSILPCVVRKNVRQERKEKTKERKRREEKGLEEMR
jgi:hypothetical protein